MGDSVGDDDWTSRMPLISLPCTTLHYRALQTHDSLTHENILWYAFSALSIVGSFGRCFWVLRMIPRCFVQEYLVPGTRYLVHSLHIFVSRTWCIFSPFPPSRPPFDQNQAPTSLKTPSSPQRLYDLQGSLDNKLLHFLPQLSDFVPLRNGFHSFRAQTA